jgi:precorrin-4 methylase
MKMLSGYKTYITAGVTVIGAVAAYLTGEATLAVTAQLVVTALLAAFLRNGVAKA